MKKLIWLGLIILIAGCDAAAAPLPTYAPTPKGVAATNAVTNNLKNKTLTAAWAQEPDFITPYYTQMPLALSLAQLTLLGLAEWDDKGNLVPELAEMIPTSENGGISPDGLTITWKLKKNLKWSDGQPLTARDVKFTWESLRNPQNKPANSAGYEAIEKIDLPDELTVQIKFKTVATNWQLLFTQGAHNAGAILPAHIFANQTQLEAQPEIRQPKVGSGPFVVSAWQAGRSLTLVPNPNFYKGKPRLEKIVLRFVPTPEAALAVLTANEVDWAPDFNETDLPTLQKLAPRVQLSVLPAAAREFLFFNLDEENGACPLRQSAVRQALWLGINRAALAEKIYGVKSNVPASMWVNTSLTAPAYNVEGAKQLLEGVGYKAGGNGDGIRTGKCGNSESRLTFNFTLIDTPTRREVASLIQRDLKQIGIEVKTTFVPFGDFLGGYDDGAILARGKFELATLSGAFYPNPRPNSWSCAALPSAANPEGENYARYCQPELEKMLGAWQASADPATQQKYLSTMQNYFYDQALVIPLYARLSIQAYTARFSPAPFSVLSGIAWNAELWDVK